MTDTDAEDTFDVEDEQAETEGDEEEPFDPIATADAYLAAGRSERIAIWAELDDDQRADLALGGITGPVSTAVDDDFELVEADDPGFASTMRMSRAKLRQGLGYIRKGDLDATEELASQLEEYGEIAEAYPEDHPKAVQALQHGAYLVEAAIAAAKDAIPFDDSSRPRIREGGINAQGQSYTKETDHRGKVRMTIWTPEELAEAEAAYDADHGARPGHRPWGAHPEAVTVQELAGYDYATFKTFEAEHRDHVDALLAASSVALQLDD